MNRLLIAVLLAISLLQAAVLAGSAGSDDAITYRIDERVTAEDEAYIREGIRLAQDYLLETLDVTVDGPVIVNARATAAPANLGEVAEASDGFIAYFTRSSGWYRSSPAYRLEVVVHEFVHVYQIDELGRHQTGAPAWMMEGTAEFLASDALISRGLLDPGDAEHYRYWTIADAPLDELADYEQHTLFRQADARVYGLAYLGMAWLAEESGTASIGAFFELVGNGADWDDAFEEAFSLTPRAFYRAFEAERGEFLHPSEPPDVYAELEPVDSASPARITSLPETIVPGEQLVMLARSEPHARCIAYLWGESLDLAHETTADAGADLFWLVTIPEETAGQPAELSIDCGDGATVAEIAIEQ
jgi:hypothetical protein